MVELFDSEQLSCSVVNLENAIAVATNNPVTNHTVLIQICIGRVELSYQGALRCILNK